MAKKTKNKLTNEFYFFADNVNFIRKTNMGKINKVQEDALQEKQVNELLEKEESFKRLILSYSDGNNAYKRFLDLILKKNKNILTAKPYFRERAKVFFKKIAPALKNEDPKALQVFKVNYKFFAFMMEGWQNPPQNVKESYKKIEDLRRQLIENNIPLAVSQARKFFRKVHKPHLTYMDLIGVCGEGLIDGIDKFDGPYTKGFRSVCLGRMTGYLIESASETALKFFPREKRLMYYVNILKSRQGISDPKEIANKIIEDPNLKALKPTHQEVLSLIDAMHTSSCDTYSDSDGEDEDYSVYSFTPSETPHPAQIVEEKNTHVALLKNANELSLMERKILQLKGVVLPKYRGQEDDNGSCVPITDEGEDGV